MCSVSARITLACSGVLFIKEQEVEYDYRKYLGPDWKPDRNLKPGSIITNH